MADADLFAQYVSWGRTTLEPGKRAAIGVTLCLVHECTTFAGELTPARPRQVALDLEGKGPWVAIGPDSLEGVATETYSGRAKANPADRDTVKIVITLGTVISVSLDYRWAAGRRTPTTTKEHFEPKLLPGNMALSLCNQEVGSGRAHLIQLVRFVAGSLPYGDYKRVAC